MIDRCALRHGNVRSADDWEDVLDPVIARYATRDLMRLRADGAFASPAIYTRLEDRVISTSVCPPMPCCARRSRSG